MSKIERLRLQVEHYSKNEFDYQYLKEVTEDILTNREDDFLKCMLFTILTL